MLEFYVSYVADTLLTWKIVLYPLNITRGFALDSSRVDFFRFFVSKSAFSTLCYDYY